MKESQRSRQTSVSDGAPGISGDEDLVLKSGRHPSISGEANRFILLDAISGSPVAEGCFVGPDGLVANGKMDFEKFFFDAKNNKVKRNCLDLCHLVELLTTITRATQERSGAVNNLVTELHQLNKNLAMLPQIVESMRLVSESLGNQVAVQRAVNEDLPEERPKPVSISSHILDSSHGRSEKNFSKWKIPFVVMKDGKQNPEYSVAYAICRKHNLPYPEAIVKENETVALSPAGSTSMQNIFVKRKRKN